MMPKVPSISMFRVELFLTSISGVMAPSRRTLSMLKQDDILY
jgi:hypothetical protein